MNKPKTKVIHIVLWIFQIILGIMFLLGGAAKAFQPLEELTKQLAWAEEVSIYKIRLAGISEILGALGLVLPSIFRKVPILTPLAALGLALIMVLAAEIHLYRREFFEAGINAIIFCIMLFIAWGRFKKAPIISR